MFESTNVRGLGSTARPCYYYDTRLGCAVLSRHSLFQVALPCLLSLFLLAATLRYPGALTGCRLEVGTLDRASPGPSPGTDLAGKPPQLLRPQRSPTWCPVWGRPVSRSLGNGGGWVRWGWGLSTTCMYAKSSVFNAEPHLCRDPLAHWEEAPSVSLARWAQDPVGGPGCLRCSGQPCSQLPFTSTSRSARTHQHRSLGERSGVLGWGRCLGSVLSSSPPCQLSRRDCTSPGLSSPERPSDPMGSLQGTQQSPGEPGRRAPWEVPRESAQELHRVPRPSVLGSLSSMVSVINDPNQH